MCPHPRGLAKALPMTVRPITLSRGYVCDERSPQAFTFQTLSIWVSAPSTALPSTRSFIEMQFGVWFLDKRNHVSEVNALVRLRARGRRNLTNTTWNRTA